MNGPALPRCALARLVPVEPTSDAHLYRMRLRAWRELGLAILSVSEIADPWTRQAISNEAIRLYGDRDARGK